jgi:hypothetical protein
MHQGKGGYMLKSPPGKKQPPTKPYVDAGFRLTYKLAYSLSLDDWAGILSSYTEKEAKAVKQSRAVVQKAFADLQFYPQASEPMAEQYRRQAARALRDLAGEGWDFTRKETLPPDWKQRVSTYLKSWTVDLSPLSMHAVAELLILAGYKSEAKEAWQLFLLYPSEMLQTIPALAPETPPFIESTKPRCDIPSLPRF